MIVLPTAIINGTPLDCTLCQKDICPEELISETDPKLNAWWVKKYCTYTAVDNFILYFPFVLLVIALLLILIERGFISIFKAGMELNNFYKLLQSEDLLDDKESSEEEENTDIDENKIAIEIAQSFGPNSNYFISYLLRTLAEFLTSSILLFYLFYFGLNSFNTEDFIYCPVGEYHYQCAGHPKDFYEIVFYITIVIVIIYILCCVYNLLWLLVPQFGSLSGLMNKYKSEFKHENDQDIIGDLHDVYYKNSDLKLLLDLLAASSGIAISIRILCLFDKNLRKMSKVGNLKINQRTTENEDNVDICVEFEDPFAIKNIFSKLNNTVCIYTAEVLPALPSVSNFQSQRF